MSCEERVGSETFQMNMFSAEFEPQTFLSRLNTNSLFKFYTVLSHMIEIYTYVTIYVLNSLCLGVYLI